MPDFDIHFIKIVETVFLKALNTYLGFSKKGRFSDVDVDARATDIMAFLTLIFWI